MVASLRTGETSSLTLTDELLRCGRCARSPDEDMRRKVVGLLGERGRADFVVVGDDGLSGGSSASAVGERSTMAK